MAKKTDTQEAVAAYDWDNYQGNTGLENLTNKDLGIPILQIMQKGSAEVDVDMKTTPPRKSKELRSVTSSTASLAKFLLNQ
jgi:hypothetical protein